ncbi:MAG TPA: hypothetical protein VFY06_10160, partial [Verrucomicrobiae bacterium]|nr:hypothetical protein [Verrucomicrobiae bacterium]
WNPEVSPEELTDRLQSTNRFDLFALVFGPEAQHPAYWFETRKGLEGILQITGFTENPRGVKIRYKLVQNGQPASVTAASALQFRLIAPEGSSEPADRLPGISGGTRFSVLREILMDGSAVAQASLNFNTDASRKIEIQFTEPGKRRFAEITASNIHHQLAIVFRGKVLSAPYIQSAIPGGQCQIEGGMMSRKDIYALLDCLNRTTNASDQTWKFAAPRERILPQQPIPEFLAGWLDLDSGTVMTNSKLDWESRAGHQWIRSNGLDIATTDGSKEIPVLLSFDMVLSSAPTNAWDAATPVDVAENWDLQQNEPQQMKMIGAAPGQSDMFFFRTREGAMGILQVLGFTDNPPGVKIRYKLVENQTSGPTNYPGDWIWEPNSETLARVPPIFLLRSSTMPTNWIPFEMFGQNRFLARGKTLKELIAAAWSQKNSALKIKFDADLPDEKFDFIVTAQPHWWDKLQSEIDRRFHLVEQIESGENGDVVVNNAPQSSQVPTASEAAEFGQEVERVLSFDDNGLTDLLDLNSGLIVRPQPKVTGLPALLAAAGISFSLAEHMMAVSPDATMQTAHDAWDSQSAADVKMAAEKLQFHSAINAISVSESKLPETFLFRTRAGKMGVLQITGFTENPPGVKIRYKLVQNVAANAPPIEDEITRLQREIAGKESQIAGKKFQVEVLSQAGKNLSASNIVALSRLAYSTIYTYRDTGWTYHSYGTDVWTNHFTERLGRMNCYNIEVITAPHPFSRTNRWWADGETEYWQQVGSAALKNSHPGSEGSELSLANHDSAVPALFYNLNWGDILSTLKFSSPAELARLKDEPVGGVDCYVLEKADSGMKVWFGKEDFLIRRYRQFIPKSVAAEAIKRAGQTNSAPQDSINIETHEHVLVNEPLSKAGFLPEQPGN